MQETGIDIGTVVNNRYQIQKTIGQGGFGRTYLAYDRERFDEPCVLKEFLPPSKQHAAPKARELFQREARILYQIDHPQIPKFLSWFEYANRLFIVQEYIDGKTYLHLLNDRLSNNEPPFSADDITQLLVGLLPVLGYLHDNNTVHRDISPENIMFPEGETKPVLIDFGLVKQTITEVWAMTSSHSGVSAEASYVGKFGYAPPEQIRMGQCYPCSDLYSLAVTAIVLLTGRDPGRLVSPSLEWQWRDYTTVDEPLAAVLDRMLAEKPSDRYQSAQDILADLEPAEPPTSDIAYAKLEISIDQTDKDLQLAEIEETDYFKQLHSKAEQLRRNVLASKSEASVSPLLEPTPVDPQSSRLPNTLSDLIGGESFQLPVTPSELMGDGAPGDALDEPFIQHCQQLLQQYVGVMAACILEDALDEDPTRSKQELIEVLSAEIPDANDATQFKRQLMASPTLQSAPLLEPSAGVWLSMSESQLLNAPFDDRQDPTPPEPVPAADSQNAVGAEALDALPDTGELVEPRVSAELNGVFQQACQQALSRYVGVMAACILEDALEECPDVSKSEFIDILADEIPDPNNATSFRQELLAVIRQRPPSPPPPAAPPVVEQETDPSSFSLSFSTPSAADAADVLGVFSDNRGEQGDRVMDEPLGDRPDEGPEAMGDELVVSFDEAFLQQCRQVLSQYVGMMATCILEETLIDFPDVSPVEFVDKLAIEIPNPQQADSFKRQLLATMDSPTTSARESRDGEGRRSVARWSSANTRSNASFSSRRQPLSPQTVELCQQELCRSLGPMASYIVEDILDDDPDLSIDQLLDRLMDEIPNRQQAVDFRERLLQSMS